jgi:hypothetical protein
MVAVVAGHQKIADAVRPHVTSGHAGAGVAGAIWLGDCQLKHRNVDYTVYEIEPGRWRWVIYSDGEAGSKVTTSHRTFRKREAAVAACIGEIENALERRRQAPRRKGGI